MYLPVPEEGMDYALHHTDREIAVRNPGLVVGSLGCSPGLVVPAARRRSHGSAGLGRRRNSRDLTW
jgi:hypothetical protein